MLPADCTLFEAKEGQQCDQIEPMFKTQNNAPPAISIDACFWPEQR
jgi:hypothetical protein